MTWPREPPGLECERGEVAEPKSSKSGSKFLKESQEMDTSLRATGVYVFASFRLDATRRILLRDGQPVSLSSRVFDTLLYLVDHADRVIEKDELLNAVWAGRFVEEANLSQTIFVLRKTLRDLGEADELIATISGRGYRFTAPVRRDAGSAAPAAQPNLLLPGFDTPVAAAETAGAREAAVSSRAWFRYAALGGAAFLFGAVLLFMLVWRTPRATEVVAGAFRPPPRSVAVLAFANMSGDPGQDYLSDGFAEELIDTLSGVKSLFVADRASAFYFKNHPAPVTEIAHRLNVGAVLEGSIRREGQRLRIAVQLINAASGYQFWSRSYDRNFGDILKLQSEIAENVTRSLRATLHAGGPMQSAMGGTANSAAFDAFLRGIRFTRGRDEASFRSALAAFDDAVRLDPRYAGAHSMRAIALLILAGIGPTDTANTLTEIEAKALDAANRAVALAPGWGPAHAARGSVLASMLDFPDAERELSEARALAPNNVSVDRAYEHLESTLGHPAAAEAAAARVIARNPTDSYGYWDQALVLYLGRRYQDSLAASRHAAALSDTAPPGDQAVAALDWLALKRPQIAHDACAPNRNWQQTECLAIAAYQLGHLAEAKAQLANLRRSLGDWGAYNYSQIYAQWGDRKNAIAWLNTAYRLHDTGLGMLKEDALLDPIRGMPEFADIERRLNFPP